MKVERLGFFIVGFKSVPAVPPSPALLAEPHQPVVCSQVLVWGVGSGG